MTVIREADVIDSVAAALTRAQIAAGPPTANRMDRFTDTTLGKAGLLAMVGKAERGPETVGSIAKYGSAYLIAVE